MIDCFSLLLLLLLLAELLLLFDDLFGDVLFVVAAVAVVW